MKRLFVSVLALAVLITPAFAIASPPVELSDAEMDNITAGALLNVTVGDVIVRNNEIIKNVEVDAALAVAAQVLTSDSTSRAVATITK